MRQMIRTSVLALGMTAALAGGAWTVQAQGPKGGGEKHPVLRNSMNQLEGIRDRLLKAPSDFGGHKAKAIEAISGAMNELQQAIAFDAK
jgi:hypothetical protein